MFPNNQAHANSVVNRPTRQKARLVGLVGELDDVAILLQCLALIARDGGQGTLNIKQFSGEQKGGLAAHCAYRYAREHGVAPPLSLPYHLERARRIA